MIIKNKINIIIVMVTIQFQKNKAKKQKKIHKNHTIAKAIMEIQMKVNKTCKQVLYKCLIHLMMILII